MNQKIKERSWLEGEQVELSTRLTSPDGLVVDLTVIRHRDRPKWELRMYAGGTGLVALDCAEGESLATVAELFTRLNFYPFKQKAKDD